MAHLGKVMVPQGAQEFESLTRCQMKENMWNVIYEDTVLNASPTLGDAIIFAKGYGRFVTITDGTTEIVGAFGVDAVENKILPDGESYTWTIMRDENHRSSRKKLV